MMDTDYGRDPLGQALAVPVEPQERLAASRCDPSRVDAAIALAVEAHRGQVDKAGAAYILHPLRVMGRFSTPDAQIAAVLHDTVEDTGLELRLIRHRFGDLIADAVDALSRREGESYTAFIERCGVNGLARMVKVADLQDNSDLSRLPEYTRADADRTEKYGRAIDRLSAIAMETRSATTAGRGPQDDSAAIAQPIANSIGDVS